MNDCFFFFFFSSRRRHTRYWRDWSSDVCSSDLLNVAEVHTVGQLLVLGIHTNACTERACLIRLYFSLESIVVTFVTYNLELMNIVDFAVITFGVVLQQHEFQTDGVIKSLLVNNVGKFELRTGLTAVVKHRVVLGNNVDGIPTLGNILFPKGYFLSQLVVIG